MAAGDNGLDQIATLDLIDHDGRPQHKPHALPSAQSENNNCREREPPV
jgi:hypothetical protein